jgi:hypothetical protein
MLPLCSGLLFCRALRSRFTHKRKERLLFLYTAVIQPRCRSPPFFYQFSQPKKLIGDRKMKEINLRTLFPEYELDCFIEVPDEDVEAFTASMTKETAAIYFEPKGRAALTIIT